MQSSQETQAHHTNSPNQEIQVTYEDCVNAKNTLFVFYIPPAWEENDIFVNFNQFGPIENCRVCRKPDRSSRGYGFVKFTTPETALKAINTMNGMDVGFKKRLKVQLKSPTTRNTQKPHNSKAAKGCTVFVFYLPSDWTDETLKQHFNHYGKIWQCTVQKDTCSKSKGFGFVSFEKASSAHNAINGMNGFSAGNKFLKVSVKKGDEEYDLVQPNGWHGQDPPVGAQMSQYPAGSLSRPGILGRPIHDAPYLKVPFPCHPAYYSPYVVGGYFAQSNQNNRSVPAAVLSGGYNSGMRYHEMQNAPLPPISLGGNGNQGRRNQEQKVLKK